VIIKGLTIITFNALMSTLDNPEESNTNRLVSKEEKHQVLSSNKPIDCFSSLDIEQASDRELIDYLAQIAVEYYFWQQKHGGWKK
jgi:hypothetical protein